MKLNQHTTGHEFIQVKDASAPVNLHLFGIDHTGADTQMREAAYLDAKQIQGFQQAFAAEQCGVASLVLCTCNRTEIYLEVQGGCQARSALRRSLNKIGVDSELFLSPPGWQLSGIDVVRHLHRVACGLESMVLGEAQISAQMKKAFHMAQENEHLGPFLMRAFQGAFRSGKRVRTETGVSSGPVSVAYIAVEEAHRRLGGLTGLRALLVGAGKTGTLAARQLVRRGITDLAIVNRSDERAQTLAGEVQADLGRSVQVHPFAELGTALAQADVVLTATGCPDSIIDAAMVRQALHGRNGTPLYLCDLAVPRDIDPEVESLERVQVVGLDQLSGIVEENLRARRKQVPHAEQILAEELEEFVAWARVQHIGPTMAELRTVLEGIAAKELDWVRRKQPTETAEIVEKSLQVFIKRLMQRPAMQLKSAEDETVRCQDLDCLQRLFDLNGSPEPHGGGNGKNGKNGKNGGMGRSTTS